MQTAKQIQPASDTFGPTLRDKARRCRVERAFGDYFKVTGESGRPYAVKAVWDFEGNDVTAECRCPDAVCRKHQCKHALAVVMFERSRVAEAQGFYC
jgi:hypothetical protein